MTDKMTPEEDYQHWLESLSGSDLHEDCYFVTSDEILELDTIIVNERAQAVEEYRQDLIRRGISALEDTDRNPAMILVLEIYRAFGWQGGTIHQVIAEIKRLREVGKGHQWQPIETAPKDTSQYILASRTTGRAYWIVFWHPMKDGWFIPGANTSVCPTHWMPLPEPPQSQMKEGI